MSENWNEENERRNILFVFLVKKHHTWPLQIAKLVIIIELSADGTSQTWFHNTKSVCFMQETP